MIEKRKFKKEKKVTDRERETERQEGLKEVGEKEFKREGERKR